MIKVNCPWCNKEGFSDPNKLGEHMLKCPKKPVVERIGPWTRLGESKQGG